VKTDMLKMKECRMNNENWGKKVKLRKESEDWRKKLNTERVDYDNLEERYWRKTMKKRVTKILKDKKNNNEKIK
jgi:hypothetical protein